MDQAPSSLYFDVAQGQLADLEVVARTSIAWAALVKEVAFVLDPSAEIQVQFVTSTPGSAFVNNLTTAVKKAAKENPLIAGPLIAIATTFALAIPVHLADDAAKDFLAKVGHVHTDEISDESARKIAEEVVKLERNNIAREQRKELYRQSERDEKIIGFGIGRTFDKRPEIVVPRSDFRDRFGVGELIQTSSEIRYELQERYPVEILRSSSQAKEAMWRFSSDSGEFSAKMKDRAFLDALRSGHTGLEIGEGVEIGIDLKTKLERRDGVWTIVERTVERVHAPKARQSELHFAQD